MDKRLVNKYCRKFGFEVHGAGYIQSVAKQSFKEDAFIVQRDQLNGQVKTIFDLGANRGDTVARYLQLFPSAMIYAFEPFIESFKILNERFKENPRVTCHALAISNREGENIFYVNKNVDTNSLLRPKETGLSSDRQVENKDQIKVQATTLGKFCLTNGISTIDILKMDIQGGELAALQGVENLLKDQRIKLIYTETYFIQQYDQQPLFHDISKFLFNYNYVLKDIYSPIYGKGNLSWADVIFVSKI